MDTTQLTHVSLCAGYGGIDLGLRRVLPSVRTVAYSEIEEFACALLASRMASGQIDVAPIWSNLKTFPWEKFYGLVDILSGGYPCQPFSAAGKRRGQDDPRHLWPFIADGVSRMQPRVVFFENVEGHISLGLREVIADLESRGYSATWGLFSAAECGAPHQRKRVFILAHANNQRSSGPRNRLGQISPNGQGGQNTTPHCSAWPSYIEEQQKHWEPSRIVRKVEPALGRNTDGPSGGMDYAHLSIASKSSIDELRLLGNGVVPATAALAFVILAQELGL